ncbi:MULTISPECIES: VOC family protein [Nostocales]|uniref:Glyoxalase/bleomycin resistance/dioxygenase family protein n=3 Tax=Nostocales TaxID=1161 RepID=A0A0C1R658_9CYAN|nr:VOC family protein [Tolypothrix bouteillei]KAF3887974.1 glyoxalase/bleomycin resistance/dioxygenase family protein [Tolypothrix bouteillei VB521301]
MFKGIRAVFFFVDDVVVAANWYSQLLNLPIKYFYINNEVRGALINVIDVEMFFHQADEKMRPGNAGQIAYWSVDSFYQAMELAQKHGAKLYRGPLTIENNQAICQMWDPFGNLFGLQGSTLESP